ncbi:MAG: FAD-binding oxidoreductase [Elusimicrobiaceae bacterium]|nr:FAD-binding oxidoreductase [Elusimicrobiaceae bacterium]
MPDKNNTFDAIIVGAGSVGVPAAVALAQEKLRVLVVDELSANAQGQGKAAIGGIRATHSDGAKITACLRSLEIFSGWKDAHGDDIGWIKGGYTFPAYNESDENMMRELLKVQKKFGLNIDWLNAEEMLRLVPGLNPAGLRGGTLSPDDGSASTLLSNTAFYRRAGALGAEFRFKEKILSAVIEKGVVKGITTAGGTVYAPAVLNCAGASAREVAALFGVDSPVSPDMHEAGITEPVAMLFKPMVVDIRPAETSKNFYFYQNHEGQILFCMTPRPTLWGKNTDSTSSFLPAIAKRMVEIMPRFANVKVRRTWRGLYPMTPDGFPIVHRYDSPKGYIAAIGMCGQGFMLGPGLGELLARLVTGKSTATDGMILAGFSADRSFSGTEKFA